MNDSANRGAVEAAPERQPTELSDEALDRAPGYSKSSQQPIVSGWCPFRLSRG